MIINAVGGEIHAATVAGEIADELISGNLDVCKRRRAANINAAALRAAVGAIPYVAGNLDVRERRRAIMRVHAAALSRRVAAD